MRTCQVFRLVAIGILKLLKANKARSENVGTVDPANIAATFSFTSRPVLDRAMPLASGW